MESGEVVIRNKREKKTEHKTKSNIYLNCYLADPNAVSGSVLFIY